ncbi:predicted protein [Lichtheimia corymbifera JMRC:FSU:9682]|uniref:Uncharacterized protein n=1 Tax=Lichtheimia corymbifera JMRC:FSU:9682 TaxID=1263082 RepID=A0A068S0M0_9FUNG|nr:predicted protein [Lichtheimia corymbifera JMRC:FSU:9682]
MPAAGTFFTIGAVGAAGAALYMNKRRNSVEAGNQQSNSNDMSPHAMARRRSSGLVQNDLYEARKQAEHHWRRQYGANFSHNSHPSFPMMQNTK